MTDNDAADQFAREMRQQMAVRKQEYKARSKNNAVMRAIRHLCSITDIDAREVIEDAGEADPLTTLCRSHLPPTSFGRIGLYLPDLTPAKAFSMFFIKPRKATERLEIQLEEAMCIYPADIFPIVGVIFLSTDKKMFVYCNSGVVDQTSCAVLRFNRKTRFIYSLDAFCRALGLWRRNDTADED